MSLAHTTPHARFSWKLLSRLAARFTQTPRLLDTRLLPEHLQRDVGYLDGSGAMKKASFHLDEIPADRER